MQVGRWALKPSIFTGVRLCNRHFASRASMRALPTPLAPPKDTLKRLMYLRLMQLHPLHYEK